MPETTTRSFGKTPALLGAHLDGLQDAEISATRTPVRIDNALKTVNGKLYDCGHLSP